MNLIIYGFYYIADQFFIDFPDPYLKGNKNEKRPHYFSFKDSKTNLIWVIPLTSSENKLKDYYDRLKEGKQCDIFHKTNLAGRDGLMLIADMFPITEKYITEKYIIDEVHVVYKDKKEIREIYSKASKILRLLRKGVKFTSTQPNVFIIEKQLLDNCT